MSGKTVALVLGSGGARGYAHIGALQVLEERGYRVVAIAGTSIGALIGGLYAAGKLQEFVDWVTPLTHRDVLRLLDPTLLGGGGGAFRLERVLARMSEILDGAQIEELAIPYTAVATDIGARREVWFTSGPVDVAIRASVAIPGVITPIMVNGRLLVDGGVLNPVPMEPVIGSGADFTLAVELAGDPGRSFTASPTKETAAQRPPNEWLDRFIKGAAGVWENDFIASIMARFGRSPSDDGEEHEEIEADAEDKHEIRPAFDPPPPGVGLTDVAAMALETMGALVTRYRMATLPPDVSVTVPGDAAKTLDFHRATELIELGRKLTEEALDRAFPEDAPSAAIASEEVAEVGALE